MSKIEVTADGVSVVPDTVMGVDLPRLISTTDYHDFQTLEYFLRFDMEMNVVVEEVGCLYDAGVAQFIGLVYIEGNAGHERVKELLELYYAAENE